MANPSVISTSAESIYASNHSMYRPFYIGGAMYACVQGDSTEDIDVAKQSTEGGIWATQDGTNNPTETAVQRDISVANDGTTMHIAHQKGVSGDLGLRYSTFTYSSDTWGTVNESVDTVTGAGSASPGNAPGIALRSDGDVILCYEGDAESNMGTNYDRTYLARRESGTWTTGIRVDNLGKVSENIDPLGIVVQGDSANDRMHAFYFSNVNGSYVSTYLSGNTFGQQDHSITANQNTLDAVSVGVGAAARKIRWLVEPTTDTVNVYGFTDADAPTVSTIVSDVLGSETDNTLSASASFAFEERHWFGYLLAGTQDDIRLGFSDRRELGPTYNTTLMKNGTADIFIAGASIFRRSGVLKCGYTYKDSSIADLTYRYDEFTILDANWELADYAAFTSNETGNTTVASSLIANANSINITQAGSMGHRWLIKETNGSILGEEPKLKMQYKVNTGSWNDIVVVGDPIGFAPGGPSESLGVINRIGSGTLRDSGHETSNEMGSTFAATQGNDEYEIEFHLTWTMDTLVNGDVIYLRALISEDFGTTYAECDTVTVAPAYTLRLTDTGMEQEAWRLFADDNATITSCTPLAAINTDPGDLQPGDNFHIGFRVSPATALAPHLLMPFGSQRLEYRIDTGTGFGSWTDMTAKSSAGTETYPFIDTALATAGSQGFSTAIIGSTSLEYGGARNGSINSYVGTEPPGGLYEDADQAEYLWYIKIGGGMSNGDIIEVRMKGYSASNTRAYNTYTNTPNITLGTGGPSTYEESITLAGQGALTYTPENVMEVTVTLGGQGNAAFAAGLDYQDTFTVGGQGDFTAAPDVVFEPTLTEGGQGDMSLAPDVTFETALAADASGSLTYTVENVMDAALTGGGTADLTVIGGLDYQDAITVGGVGNLTVGGALDMPVDMTAGASATLTVGPDMSFGAALSAGGTADLSLANTIDFFPAVTFGAQGDVSFVGGFAFETSFSAAADASLSVVGGLAYEATMTVAGDAALALANDMGLAASVTVTAQGSVALATDMLLSAAISAGATADSSFSAGNVMDASVTYGAIADAALAHDLTMEEAFTLAASAALSVAGNLDMLSAVTLAATADASFLDEIAGGANTYEVAIAAGASAGLALAALVDFEASLGLDATATYSLAPELVMDVAATFGATADTTLLPGLVIEKSLTLAAQGGFTNATSVVFGPSLQLGATADFVLGTQIDFEAGISINAGAGLGYETIGPWYVSISAGGVSQLVLDTPGWYENKPVGSAFYVDKSVDEGDNYTDIGTASSIYTDKG